MKYILLLAFGGTILFTQSVFAEEHPSGGLPAVHGDRYITDDDLRVSGDSLTTTVGNTTPVQVYNEYPAGSPERYHGGPNLGIDFWNEYRRPRFGGYDRDWERGVGHGGRYDDRHFGNRRPDGRFFDDNHPFGRHGR